MHNIKGMHSEFWYVITPMLSNLHQPIEHHHYYPRKFSYASSKLTSAFLMPRGNYYSDFFQVRVW